MSKLSRGDLVYVAHASRDLPGAKAWVGFFAKSGFLPIATWITLVEVWDDASPGDRELGLSIDLQMISRCRGVFLCGSVLSAGMETEKRHAVRVGVPVYYCVGMGPSEVTAALEEWVT